MKGIYLDYKLIMVIINIYFHFIIIFLINIVYLNNQKIIYLDVL